jgi:hypothetical protein
MHEFPALYSQTLQENFVETLRFAPKDWVTIEELMKMCLPNAERMQIAFRQLPRGFQASDQNALGNQLKDEGFKRVPTHVLTKAEAGSEKKRKSSQT